MEECSIFCHVLKKKGVRAYMQVGDKVEITVSDKIFRLIKLDEASVYEILRKKIGG